MHDLEQASSDTISTTAAQRHNCRAVTLLQVECEHQLGIERERTAAASQQRDAAEARAAALEVQLTELVASQRSAPESQLKVQLAEALQAAKAAEAKLHAALKLKQKYKQQVRTSVWLLGRSRCIACI
jgi:centrosomal protein CEP120